MVLPFWPLVLFSPPLAGVTRIFRHGTDCAVVEYKGDAADLPTHARQGPVAGGRTDHGARHLGKVDTVSSQVVRTDQHFERVWMTVPSIGTRPMSAVMAMEPISVALVSTV